MPQLSLDGSRVTYEVVRSARRTLGVGISPGGQVVVRVPYNVGNARITAFVERHKIWIFKHLRRHQQVCPAHRFVTGESLLYLGEKYKLKVVVDDAGEEPVLDGGHLWVRVARDLDDEARRTAVRLALVGWYEMQAQQILLGRLEALASLVGGRPKAVKVKHQTSRWGSCTARGVINLNWQLVMAPLSVIDYVVIHELCHLKVRSHQWEFWEYVARYMPDYLEHRKWLRVHGQTLGFLSP